MEGIIQDAVITSIVGMFTVFAILLLVVLSAKLLIAILNNTGFVLNADQAKPVSTSKNFAPPSEHEKLIELAIMKWSDGKAKIASLKKLD